MVCEDEAVCVCLYVLIVCVLIVCVCEGIRSVICLDQRIEGLTTRRRKDIPEANKMFYIPSWVVFPQEIQRQQEQVGNFRRHKCA